MKEEKYEGYYMKVKKKVRKRTESGKQELPSSCMRGKESKTIRKAEIR